LAGGPDGKWRGKVVEAVARMEGASEVRNPTDISSLGGLDRLDAFFRAQEADGFDGPMAFFTHLLPNTARSKLLADQIVARSTTPVVIVRWWLRLRSRMRTEQPTFRSSGSRHVFRRRRRFTVKPDDTPHRPADPFRFASAIVSQ
jgi:hypothetical protein